MIESAKARSKQAGKLANPRVGTTSGINTITSENMQGFSLQQSFPITARLRLEKKVASLDIQQAEKEVQWMAHQKVMEAMEAATRWLALRERQQILKEQITLAQELYATLKEQQERGERSQLDLSLAVIQIKGLELKQPALKSSIHSLENEMRSLVGQQAEEPFRLEATWKPMAIPSASPLDTANHPAFGVLHTEATSIMPWSHWSKAGSGRIGPWAYPTSGVSMRTYPSVWSAIAGWDFNSAFLCLGGKKT